MNRDMELRKVPAGSLTNVANILQINDDWQKVVPLIPKHITSEIFERKYNSDHIRLMAQHAKETSKKYAEVLFDEWGTSGKVRPTLGTLMMILQQAQIFRAVDEVARLIGEPPPPRPSNGPGAPITTNLSQILSNDSLKDQLNSMETVDTNKLNNSSQDHVLCNRSTRQLPVISDMMKFSQSKPLASEDMINKSSKRGLLSVPPHKKSDLIEFSDSMSEGLNVPNISRLLEEANNNDENSIQNKSYNIGTSMSFDTDDTSTSQNELSQFTPNYLKYSKSNIDIYGIIDKAILEDKKLVPFEYRELESLTNKFSESFSETPSGPVGKIGSGGFGDVYVCTHKTHGTLAVKRVRPFYQISCNFSTAMKIFNAEVKSLSHLRHENIVPIFGYSINGPSLCIVCKYIDGGSLQQNIAAKVLTEQQRMFIIKGTAEGLKYIHHTEKPPTSDSLGMGVADDVDSSSSKKSYYLHGDIKSANILLTRDCVPKLCDFGLAKQLESTVVTKSLMGTFAYMAPEGFKGTRTQKNDIFSFGIVLLEIITGLRPVIVVRGEEININDYVKDECPDGNISKVVDRMVPKWRKAQKIYELARQCLQHDKSDRPTIGVVCDILNSK